MKLVCLKNNNKKKVSNYAEENKIINEETYKKF